MPGYDEWKQRVPEEDGRPEPIQVGDTVMSRSPGHLRFVVQAIKVHLDGKTLSLGGPDGHWYDSYWFRKVAP